MRSESATMYVKRVRRATARNPIEIEIAIGIEVDFDSDFDFDFAPETYTQKRVS